MKTRFLFVLVIMLLALQSAVAQQTVSLDGIWQIGEGRKYVRDVSVPGVHCDPTKMNTDTLWYRRVVTLPKGDWKYATLELKGARFAPSVFVDGKLVSHKSGGMAPTFHLLKGKNVKPGRKVTIEIALQSLATLPKTDASYIPASDHWRSNISSCLWDDVLLHVHGTDMISNIIPDTDPYKKTLGIKFIVDEVEPAKGIAMYKLDIADSDGNVLVRKNGNYTNGSNDLLIAYGNVLKEWSPEQPNIYKMTVALWRNGKAVERKELNLGLKRFEIKGKHFLLNGKPCHLRGGSFVWHRWMRSPEGLRLGYDTAWFEKNVIRRMKEHGANEINFHLGLAPSRLLDICDKYGIMVRYEWLFFHGMPASEESCREQYGAWLASSMEHPSATYYYPYNETTGDELKRAWNALDSVLKDYPHVVVAHRDVEHFHKYWWSIFENLGLYYDNYDQFEKATICDEFGGNYLDKDGYYGGYPSVKEMFPRYIGRHSTKEMRLYHQNLSIGKVGEYWRRLNIAGWMPYTIMSSYEDGNSWFLGDFLDGRQMPVWDGMTAVWSPQAVSMNIWDVNFEPGQTLKIPMYYFNDLDSAKELRVKFTITDSNGRRMMSRSFSRNTPAFSQVVDTITVTLPDEQGDYRLSAELVNPPSSVKYPVVSSWDVRTFSAVTPDVLKTKTFYAPVDEEEIRKLFATRGLKTTTMAEKADVIVLSLHSWNKLAAGDKKINDMIEKNINAGKSVVMLDAGPRSLGMGYPKGNGKLDFLFNPPSVKTPKLQRFPLFGSISLVFRENAEAETNLFPDTKDSTLWAYMPKSYRGMWNGLRGDLVVPAWDMELQGVNADLFLDQWLARGADQKAIKSGKPYYAYELHGYYKFAGKEDDFVVKKSLKDYVQRVIEDAPSLAVFIDTRAPIQVTDLSAGYKAANTGMAKHLIRLANAGKNLTRVPVMKIEFGEGRGNLVVSQLLTADRLAPRPTTGGFYDIRYDEAAVQTVLNMFADAIK